MGQVESKRGAASTWENDEKCRIGCFRQKRGSSKTRTLVLVPKWEGGRDCLYIALRPEKNGSYRLGWGAKSGLVKPVR